MICSNAFKSMIMHYNSAQICNVRHQANESWHLAISNKVDNQYIPVMCSLIYLPCSRHIEEALFF